MTDYTEHEITNNLNLEEEDNFEKQQPDDSSLDRFTPNIIELAEEGLESELEYDDCDEECVQVYRIKIVFVVVCFLEAYIVGLIPTWVPSCRKNP